MEAAPIFAVLILAACHVYNQACNTTECDSGTCVQVGPTELRVCHLKQSLHYNFGNPRWLYRILRPDEIKGILSKKGITAKDITAKKTIQSHVGCGSGSNYASQFISCTTDIEAALDFGYLTVKNQKLPATVYIATISWTALINNNIPVHDLNDAGRDVLTGIMAYNFAHRYHEALVEKHIPQNCITDVKTINITEPPKRKRC